METNIANVLSCFGLHEPSNITQIYRSAWDINDTYVLKANDDKGQLDKSILMSRLFLSEGVSAVEYMDTTDNKPYVILSVNTCAL